MDKILDIDRSLPPEAEVPPPPATTSEPVAKVEPDPTTPPKVKARVGPSRSPAPPLPQASGPAGEPAKPPKTPRPSPFSMGGGLSRERLSALAGISLAAFFFFLYFGLYESDAYTAGLLYYTVTASLIGAAALWFFLRAERFDRVQANFLAGILAVVGLVILWKGVDSSDEAWKMVMAVSLSSFATFCFLKAQVVEGV